MNIKYGKLYDWEAANNVCPSGWKLPSKTDYDNLLDYVEDKKNGYFAGKILKSVEGWGDYGGSDVHKFSAFPGGYRESIHNISFIGLGEKAFWWTSTESGEYSYYRNVGESENLYSGLDNTACAGRSRRRDDFKGAKRGKYERRLAYAHPRAD